MCIGSTKLRAALSFSSQGQRSKVKVKVKVKYMQLYLTYRINQDILLCRIASKSDYKFLKLRGSVPDPIGSCAPQILFKFNFLKLLSKIQK